MNEILISGHEAEMAAIAAKKQDDFWAGVARQEAANWLRAAAELLEGQGPSLWSQMFGGQDAPDWRENEARRYMAKARHALLRARN